MGRMSKRDGGSLRRVALETQAQATVEMAIVTPVLLALALIVYNLMQFVAATARFDRVAPDIVIAHGVAPAGEEGRTPLADASGEIRGQIERAMTGHDVEVEVAIESDASAVGEGLLSMVGGQRTYRCVMTYVPWPGGWSIAGVSLGTPVSLKHERSITVDPWRSGVVV